MARRALRRTAPPGDDELPGAGHDQGCAGPGDVGWLWHVWEAGAAGQPPGGAILLARGTGRRVHHTRSVRARRARAREHQSAAAREHHVPRLAIQEADGHRSLPLRGHLRIHVARRRGRAIAEQLRATQRLPGHRQSHLLRARGSEPASGADPLLGGRYEPGARGHPRSRSRGGPRSDERVAGRRGGRSTVQAVLPPVASRLRRVGVVARRARSQGPVRRRGEHAAVVRRGGVRRTRAAPLAALDARSQGGH